MDITCFTAPTQCFQVFYIYICVCAFQRCCARFRDAVHVSEMLCTFQRCCARVTSPLITFVFNCIHTERILISKSIGATKHVLPIHIYIYCIWRRFHIEYTHEIPHFWWITVPSGKRLRNYGKIHHFLLLGKSTISTGPFSMSLFLCLPVVNPHL